MTTEEKTTAIKQLIVKFRRELATVVNIDDNTVLDVSIHPMTRDNNNDDLIPAGKTFNTIFAGSSQFTLFLPNKKI